MLPPAPEGSLLPLLYRPKCSSSSIEMRTTVAICSVSLEKNHISTCSMVEVERVIEAVPPIVAKLRKLSPYWGENGPVENPEQAFAPVYA